MILKTTHGDLDIELWAVQTPLTSRNFLQLCLDGYYTDTVFHRLVPDFILQGGDPTGTGHGGEAIYDGGLFADEFHTRLRFNRRGLVGMANSGRKNDNGSQFFLTLGDTKELTGRNTMFGKIVGDTLYNLVRMGQGECEEGTERPVYPVKVLGAEVVINPFEDMVPREIVKKTNTLEDAAAAARKKAAAKKKKGGKALLSFGGDEGDEPAIPTSKKPRFNTRLVVAAPVPQSNSPVANTAKPAPPKPAAKPPATTKTTPIDIDTLPDAPSPPPKKPPPTRSSRSPSSSPEPPSKSSSALAQTNAQIAALQASLRARSTSASTPAPKAPKKSLLSLQKAMLPPTSVVGRKRKRGKARATDTDDDDAAAAAALLRFQSKLTSAIYLPVADAPEPGEPVTPPQGTGSILDDDPEGNLCDLHFVPACASCGLYDRAARSQSPEAGDGLWAHTLSFEKDRRGKDLTWKKKNEELSVIDPREKEKEILGARKERRKDDGRGAFRKGFGGAGGGAGAGGGGGREWDRRRDEVGPGGGGGSGGGGGGGGVGTGGGGHGGRR